MLKALSATLYASSPYQTSSIGIGPGPGPAPYPTPSPASFTGSPAPFGYEPGRCEKAPPLTEAELRPSALNLLIGQSAALQRVKQQILRFSATGLPVIILGESGTGKELVARALHEESGRRGDFIAINCGALPRELIESELFGHERGAFTGAQRRHLGCFGEANGGTLFLDELGELPLELQPRLLRALENRAIRPVGATREQPVDVRVIAATHRDLEQAVARERFRSDLYYRLCALDIAIPPLREHPEDIPLLIRYFLKEVSGERQPPAISKSELDALSRYSWPGNVRQLRHAVLRAVHLGGSELHAEDLLPAQRLAPAPSAPFPNGSAGNLEGSLRGRSFAEIERQAYLQALAQTGGNCRAAAELLKLPKSTLHDKLRRLGIVPRRSSPLPPD